MAEVEQSPRPDWQVDELYKGAWEIIKKHKVLWIFGILAAGSGGSNFNIPDFGGSSNSSSSTKQLFETTPTPAPDTDQVLGQATSAFGDAFGQLFAQVPMWVYIVLAINLVLLIVFSIIMAVIYNRWITGSLLAGVQLAIEKKNVSIQESSEHALSRLRPLIWLSVVPGLVLGLVALPLVILPVLGLIFAPTAIKVLSGLILFVGIIAYLIVSTLLGLAQVWAPRKVITDHISGMDALKAGFHIAKKKFWAMMLLGLVNTITGGILIGIPLFIMLLLILGGSIGAAASGSETFLMGALIIIVPLIMVIIFAISFLSGVFTAFKATVWSLAYNKIRGKYDGK